MLNLLRPLFVTEHMNTTSKYMYREYQVSVDPVRLEETLKIA